MVSDSTEPTTEPGGLTDPGIVAAITNVGGRIDECRVEISHLREVHVAQTAATERSIAVTSENVELLKAKQLTAARAMRLTKRFAVVGAIVSLVLMLVSVGLWLQQRDYIRQRENDRVDNAVASCQSANATRRAFIDYIDQTNTLGYNALFDAFATLVPPSVSPDVAARQAAALDQLRATFAQKRQASKPPILGDRDCSPDAATAPTVPPPAAATTTTVG